MQKCMAPLLNVWPSLVLDPGYGAITSILSANSQSSTTSSAAPWLMARSPPLSRPEPALVGRHLLSSARWQSTLRQRNDANCLLQSRRIEGLKKLKGRISVRLTVQVRTQSLRQAPLPRLPQSHSQGQLRPDRCKILKETYIQMQLSSHLK